MPAGLAARRAAEPLPPAGSEGSRQLIAGSVVVMWQPHACRARLLCPFSIHHCLVWPACVAVCGLPCTVSPCRTKRVRAQSWERDVKLLPAKYAAHRAEPFCLGVKSEELNLWLAASCTCPGNCEPASEPAFVLRTNYFSAASLQCQQGESPLPMPLLHQPVSCFIKTWRHRTCRHARQPTGVGRQRRVCRSPDMP